MNIKSYLDTWGLRTTLDPAAKCWYRSEDCSKVRVRRGFKPKLFCRCGSIES
jgi:hypothetical protein